MRQLQGQGEIAIRLAKCAALRKPFPPDVPDTAANRQLWTDTQAQVAAMAARGEQVDIPYDQSMDAG